MKYTLLKEICVIDPDTNDPVHLEVWKDNNSGGVFAIDSNFLDQVDAFYNPFNGECEKVDEYLPDPTQSPRPLDEFGE